ncbi:hypothetical protein F5Y16DRAFT_147823 [Xylariaceae sp. FL0255]|nr:hypothetical protein F5Y16DRAFT_147823 [Xylariaceae sp. FL0255]
MMRRTLAAYQLGLGILPSFYTAGLHSIPNREGLQYPVPLPEDDFCLSRDYEVSWARAAIGPKPHALSRLATRRRRNFTPRTFIPTS